MSKITVTFPPMEEGQTGWDLYGSVPVWTTPVDDRSWRVKAIYRALIWLHGHAELFWHWCYFKSRAYAKPQSKITESKSHKIGEYRK